MSVFPEYERALREAAQRHLGAQGRPAATIGVRLGHIRRRSLLLAVLVVLGACAIALAATGVILTGAPVRPQELPNPNAGIGVSTEASGILASTPDPQGGPPWGMRIVHTTRGETCVQIGRVQNGQLGVLGIDGAFADDGRFHPIPVNALPRDFYHHTAFDQLIGSATISCALNGKALAGEHIGVDRSADPDANTTHRPPAELRDLLYGLLGPQALSVTYQFGHSSHTISVNGTTGAYLIVHGYSHKEQAGYSSQALGTFGDLAPTSPLSLIAYRIDSHICNRGPSLPPWKISHITRPCPFPHFPHSAPQPALHLPLQVHLTTHRKTVSGLSISLIAPFAITSAREHYTLIMPSHACATNPHRERSGGLQTTGRNIQHGERITWHIPKPTANGCNRHTFHLEILYSQGEGLSRTIANTTIHAPQGTSFPASPTPRPAMRPIPKTPRTPNSPHPKAERRADVQTTRIP